MSWEGYKNKKKLLREKLYKKFDGHCAYCGCELPTKWHIDHLKPVVRDSKWSPAQRRFVSDGKMLKSENDKFENLMPSCPSCNNYKSSLSLESFRTLLSNLKTQLNRISIYRIAMRYEMVKETKWDGVFYFEKFEWTVINE